MSALYGGIEAGGSHFVCAVGTGPDDLRALRQFPTSSPEATIAQAIGFFQEQAALHGPLSAVGIGSFGPVCLDLNSPRWGYITSTPKPGWADTDFAGKVQRALGVSVAFDTDVNAAALAEHRWGAGRGLDSLVYLTIGTGIGGGAVVNCDLVRGLVHPEMGHIRVPRDPQADDFTGVCPYHGDCLEGLASGPALRQRVGQGPEALPDDHPVWTLEARYLALAVSTLVCVLSPARIVLGGGVMERAHLFPEVRRQVRALLAGYVQSPAILDGIDSYIVPPVLGRRAGVLGAIALAMKTPDTRSL